MQRIAELCAVTFSSLCAAHCLFAPIALVLVPALGAQVLDDEAFHAAILWLILPMSLLALAIGCRRHKDRRVLLLGGIGLGIITLVTFFGHDVLGELGERAATLVGSGILIAGHLRNYRLCRVADCPDDRA
ncbi:MAG: MerC domain-containing protein [Reyranellaceae bacterium]